MGIFQTLHDLIFIPWYLLKQESGIINLQTPAGVDFDSLSQKLTSAGMNVIVNKLVEGDRVQRELHIGSATLPGQVYLLQEGDNDWIYVSEWGSKEFREKFQAEFVIGEINEHAPTKAFTGLVALRSNLFAIVNAGLHYYLGSMTNILGFAVMRYLYGNDHPATDAFWIPPQQ